MNSPPFDCWQDKSDHTRANTYAGGTHKSLYNECKVTQRHRDTRTQAVRHTRHIKRPSSTDASIDGDDWATLSSSSCLHFSFFFSSSLLFSLCNTIQVEKERQRTGNYASHLSREESKRSLNLQTSSLNSRVLK